ncbi:MAG TPA: IucA/IucC family protein, partial [Acidimicrobiia bacterium]|nr:IucA/IucC family protein [Acidimicrobiia bacterium]
MTERLDAERLEAQGRVVRQLLESLIYEGALDPEVGAGRWRVRRRFSFDRVRVDGVDATLSPGAVLDGLAGTLAADPDRRMSFAEELERTVENDAQALRHWRRAARAAAGAGYDELESLVVDGHRYHPSYKSRLGFGADDNQTYGPEFGARLRPVRVALRPEVVECSVLGPGRPETADGRVVLPVHPWQWRRHATTTWATLVADDALIRLDGGGDDYRAQQSIRTLANVSRPAAPTLKLALSIVTTSTARTLAPHAVANAPLITGWLLRIATGDPYLANELRPVLLGERVGVAHSPELAALWRDSLHPYLTAGERAAPFTALTHVDARGEPFVGPWVKEQGVESWARRLLEVTIPPVLHFLVAHGIGLEAHAQNLILVHEDGRPRRLALRDFSDGIRFSVAGLADPDGRPPLRPTPPEHFRVNRNSYVEATSDDDVRDFMHDCLFFVNLAELAMFLEDRFDLAEERFWSLARRVVEDHRRRFPALAERAARFDVLAPEVAVEQLTARRLL